MMLIYFNIILIKKVPNLNVRFR